MPKRRVPEAPGRVSGRKTVLRPQASQRWEAGRGSVELEAGLYES